MFDMLIDILSWACLLLGGLVGIIGGLGLVRLPDFFSRLHAAGVAETLCPLLVVLGLVLQSGISLLTLKLVLILLFLLFTAPTATHAVARAALVDGVEPEVTEDDSESTSGEPSSNT